jgi:hypothetical protein
MSDLRYVDNKSLWLFLCSSAEPRHFSDIIFGVNALKIKGVPSDNIKIFIDDPAADLYLTPYSITNVFQLSSAISILAALTGYSSVVAIVGGHGSLDGIGRSPFVLPASPLIDAIRSIPEIAFGVVILTQCFGGVFNYLPANTQPELAFVGATTLHPSLSLGISLKTPITSSDPSISLKEWSANIFGYSFFEWLLSPKDVDGDSAISLVDAFKYSGKISNDYLRDVKIQLFERSQDLSRRLYDARQSVKLGNLRQFEVDAIGRQLQEVLNLLHISQDPWILHANLARTIIFW